MSPPKHRLLPLVALSLCAAGLLSVFMDPGGTEESPAANSSTPSADNTERRGRTASTAALDHAGAAPRAHSAPAPRQSGGATRVHDPKAPPDAGNPGSLVERVYADAPRLAVYERALPKEGEFRRVTILRADLKYPIVRVVDRIRRPGGMGPGDIVRSEAMAAGHALLNVADPARIPELIARLKATGWRVRARLPLSNHLLVELPAGAVEDPERDRFPALLAELERDVVDLVAGVEPDFLAFPSGLADDPSFTDGSLWGLRNNGQSGGTAGADIGAVEAWDLRTDASPVVVAVIDTGARMSHEDLADNLWVNPGEIPGNGIDDDGNGVIDDVHGFDAIDGGGDPSDEDGHGTHVAGTIGALGNNATGVTGVAWRARLMPVRFLGENGGFLSDAIEGITYARLNGAGVLNNSWGGGGFSSALRDTIAALEADDILFVAAAGNDGNDNDNNPAYPASYDLPHIISVAASDRNDRMASFSNFGANSVDLAAPGAGIRSTFNGSDSSYASLSGTSMASPHVAGAAALLRAAFPAEDRLAIKARLIDTAEPLPDFATTTAGGGRLNLEAALLNQAPPRPGAFRFAAPGVNVAEDGGTLPVAIRRVGGTEGAVSVRYRALEVDATAGSDFVAVDGTVSWEDGENADRVVSIPIIDDEEVEGAESFEVELFGAEGGAEIGTPGRLTVNVLDDEAAPLDGFAFVDAARVDAAFALAEPAPVVAAVPSGGVVLADIESIDGDVSLLLRRFGADGVQMWERKRVSGGGVFQPRLTVADDGRVFVGYSRITLNNFGQITEADPAAMAWSTGGDLLWDAALPTPSGQVDLIQAVAHGADGGVYLGGEYAFFGDDDAFLARLDPATGAQTWIQVFKPNPAIDGDDAVSALAPADAGGVWAGGWTVGAAGFEGVLRRYAADGTVLLARRLPTQGQQRVLSLAVNDFDEVYASMRSLDNATGVFSGKLLRLSPVDGSVIWERGQAIGSNAANFLIAPTANGRIDYIQGPLGVGVDTLYSVGRFDRDGERLFENNLDALAPLSVVGMAGTASGGMVFTGAFNGLAQFGGDFLDSDGENAAYLARLTPQDPLEPGRLEFETSEFAVVEGVDVLPVVVRRVDGTDGTVSARVRSFDETARAGEDFTAIDTVLEFEPGRLSRSLDIPITDDFIVEPEKTFRLELSEFDGGASAGADTAATIRILDDDSAFDSWLGDFFQPGELDDPAVDDPDGDGLPVLHEYALGLDPTTPDAPPPMDVRPANGGRVRFVYHRGPGRDDLRFTPMISNDLQTWVQAVPVDETTEPADSGNERVTLELSAPIHIDARAFLHLEIERQSQQIGTDEDFNAEFDPEPIKK